MRAADVEHQDGLHRWILTETATSGARCRASPSAARDSGRRPRRPAARPRSIAARSSAVERDVERAERLRQPVAAARADQRHDVLAARQHPGDRDLRDASRPSRSATPRSASTSARLRSRFSPWKRGLCARKSPRAPARSLRPVAADQPARQHAVGGDRRCPSSRQVGQDLVLDAARDQRVLDLQVGDRDATACGAADRLGADLRQPDVADVAGLDQLGDRADRLLDRHVRVEPRRAVDVDVVGAEPLQRVGEEVLHRGRAARRSRARRRRGRAARRT